MRISSQVGEVMLQNLHHHSPFFLVILSVNFCLSCSLVGRKMQSRVANQNVAQNQTHANQEQEKSPRDAVRPKILSRQDWGAKEPVGKMQLNSPRHITVHHTASPQKESVTIEKKMRNLQIFSQSENRLDSGEVKPSWADVPYHYYIAFDGQIAEGRDVKYVGDTNTDYDPSGHILIVLEGNFETEQPSARQTDSLVALAAWLSKKFDISTLEIKGHNDYASTACPGINLKNMLATIRQRIAELRGPD